MLWYKFWLETRWRFLIGLAVLICSACGVVILWPKVAALLPLASNVNATGELGRQLRETLELSREYRGYVWSQWFHQNLPQMGTLFAVLLGSGSLISQSSGGLFTLSMPISRNRILATRAATGLAELFALIFIPSLLVPLFSPTVGKTYGLGDAAVHALCTFIVVAVFFSLAFLLSTVFTDIWRPLLTTLLIAVVLALAEEAIRGLAPLGIIHLMSAEQYFRTGSLPWLGLLASLSASAAMLYGASLNFMRRNF
jgi:hypothetical protein